MVRRHAAALALICLFGSVSVGPAEARRLGAVAGPVTLEPLRGSTLAVAGLHSYLGRLKLDPASDGLVVVNSLPLERYLLGLNEVPTTWPVEALRAQAVAARTYALHTLEQPPGGTAAVYGFDICASVECQVFSGADVVALPSGSRWVDAVRDTDAATILYDGRPILARYHSTSGGRTFDNEQIFETEPAYPYLQGVVSNTEEGSSVYRWRVRFRLPDLERIVENAGLLPAAGRLIEARTIASREGLHYPDVLLTTTRGERRMTAEDLRIAVRAGAPALFPGLYPSPAPTASGRLPETFPSNRLEMVTRGRVVHVLGRGWGHGVGMSQWGAEGLARRGFSYPDILQHYYTGVSIATYPTDRNVDVGVATGSPAVTVTGAFQIVGGNGRTLVREALGTWEFRFGGSGVVAVDPPRGYGLPLDVGVVEAPKRVRPGERVGITYALSRPARVKTVTSGLDRPSAAEVSAAGRNRLSWRAPEQPGRYAVQVVARAAGAEKRDTTRIVVAEVEGPEVGEPLEPIEADDPGPGPAWAWIFGGIFLGSALLWWVIKATMSP
ncbi:MAG: SpoIID/LytB domain-containing protein [Actinomycetota bacterium]